MSANVTIEYDDGSSITFFDIPDGVMDEIVDDHFTPYEYSHKV